MKPGYKTTEFWLTFAAVIGGLVMASGAFEPASCSASWCGGVLSILGLILSALGAMGYTFNRSKLKSFDTIAKAEAGSVDPS